MQFQNEQFEDVAIIKLFGKIDITVGKELTPQFESIINSNKKIIIDLTNTDYFSSYMLKLFFEVQRKLSDKNGEAVIAGANENLEQIFKLSGLIALFIFFKTKDEAIKHFSDKK